MQTDQELIRKIKRKHNKDAANMLISRYYKELYAYTFRQTGDVELAKDLTQDICIHILEKISAYDEKRASFRTWAYRLASNKITDYYRSRTYKRFHMEISMDEEEQGEGGTLADQLASGMGDLSELIVKREWIGQIMEVVAAYEKEWVDIFQRKCFEEMTFAEISKELRISENTVKSRFYQMVKRIKREVDINGSNG